MPPAGENTKKAPRGSDPGQQSQVVAAAAAKWKEQRAAVDAAETELGRDGSVAHVDRMNGESGFEAVESDD